MTMEEMKDDIEYLTGENKELQLKVKDVCLKNSQLKLKLADLKSKQRMEQEQEEMSAILVDENLQPEEDVSAIEAANNLN